jgi:hypothetical protein
MHNEKAHVTRINAALAKLRRMSLEPARELGKALLAAKQDLKQHGHWKDWLASNFPSLSYRTAAKYMQIAKAPKSAAAALLPETITEALAVIAEERRSQSGIYPVTFSNEPERRVMVNITHAPPHEPVQVDMRAAGEQVRDEATTALRQVVNAITYAAACSRQMIQRIHNVDDENRALALKTIVEKMPALSDFCRALEPVNTIVTDDQVVATDPTALVDHQGKRPNGRSHHH